MADQNDRYYEVLGLKPGASRDEVKQAYRDLVKVWHPDRFPADDRLQEKAQAKIKEVNEAYSRLRAYYASRAVASGATEPRPSRPKPRPATAPRPTRKEEAFAFTRRGHAFQRGRQVVSAGVVVVLVIILVGYLSEPLQERERAEVTLNGEEASEGSWSDAPADRPTRRGAKREVTIEREIVLVGRLPVVYFTVG